MTIDSADDSKISDHQYESNLESDVRFEIESNHEALQVPINNNNNNTLIYIAPACRMTSEAGLALFYTELSQNSGISLPVQTFAPTAIQ